MLFRRYATFIILAVCAAILIGVVATNSKQSTGVIIQSLSVHGKPGQEQIDIAIDNQNPAGLSRIYILLRCSSWFSRNDISEYFILSRKPDNIGKHEILTIYAPEMSIPAICKATVAGVSTVMSESE